MKVVGLNRMREVETELQQRFSDFIFKFYKEASEIPESDLADLDILVGYDGGINEAFLTLPEFKMDCMVCNGCKYITVRLYCRSRHTFN
ncbi:hypothetical protein ACVXZY_11295 [Staphylococcus aureus]